ncbi:hypothetical protein Ddye_030032 [Dipteronia dyeriana]|uniref:Uncharacterized protein n=1 Tax=Dipteronia dyeriana TaxID=168575 RepID=A0AAD9TFI9_9ROSI|nr:hypothetical protein Ddye_030032 [Dipteronia dyeriana]
MLGTTGLQFRRDRCGEDRFYNPAKARQQQQQHQNSQTEQLRRAKSDTTPAPTIQSLPEIKQQAMAVREPEIRAGSDHHHHHNHNQPPKPTDLPVASESVLSPASNLERFLGSITPSVQALYLSKTTMSGRRTCDQEYQPYFVLGDLWESFKEWSAYGAGVPLILNDSDSVVQYYVPYLSGIQIYSDPVNSSAKSRRLGEDSDSDFRDSSSDGSSDCEPERGMTYSREQRNHPHMGDEISPGIDRLSLRDRHSALQEDFSSDEGEPSNTQGRLIFEYMERNAPYSREPLADKISDLAFRFPKLKTLKSCDLLPSSWISVAWYPIYRIPTGPTLKDLDACFLTYHSLHTPMLSGPQNAESPALTYPSEMDSVPKMTLPVFGLASYKYKGSVWTSNGGSECQLANSLLQDADNRLRLLHVNHPDFLFFCRR